MVSRKKIFCYKYNKKFHCLKILKTYCNNEFTKKWMMNGKELKFNWNVLQLAHINTYALRYKIVNKIFVRFRCECLKKTSVKDISQSRLSLPVSNRKIYNKNKKISIAIIS